MQFTTFIKSPFPRTFVFALALGVVACKGKKELATVNGRSVPQAEFDAYLKHKHISPTDEKRRDRALDEYLERVALSALIEKEAKLDKAAIEAELAEVRRELVLSRYFERFLEEKVTDEAVKNYYDQHAKNYEQRKLHAAHILVRTNPKMSEEEKKAKRTTAQDIYAKLQSGQAFEELARTLSEDRISGAKGGDLGWLREGSIAPEFSKQVFSMKAGAVSEPFETPFGFHLVKVLEEPKVVRKPFSSALGDIRYQLRAEAKEAEMKRLKAKVNIQKKKPYELDPKSAASASVRPPPLRPPPVEIQPSADTLLPPGLDSSAVAPLPPPSAKPASSIVQRSAPPAPSAKKP
jgi:peptidyl-prolyl cis-trans isomerase C